MAKDSGKSKVHMNGALAIVFSIVGLLLVVQVLVAIIPTLLVGVSNLSTLYTNNNLPFASFFATGGIIYLIIASLIFAGVIALVMTMFKHKGGGY